MLAYYVFKLERIHPSSLLGFVLDLKLNATLHLIAFLLKLLDNLLQPLADVVRVKVHVFTLEDSFDLSVSEEWVVDL